MLQDAFDMLATYNEANMHKQVREFTRSTVRTCFATLAVMKFKQSNVTRL